MDGVDLVDQASAKFCPAIHGNKCNFLLIINALNIIMAFSWRPFQIVVDKKVLEKDFCGPSAPVLRQIRTDNVGHDPVSGDRPR